MATKGHGGRRHGLVPAGRAQRISVPVTAEDLATLARLSESGTPRSLDALSEHGCVLDAAVA